MLEQLTHAMTGFVVVSVTGPDCGRFLSLCIKSGIRFWQYRREGAHYVLSLHLSDYRQLRQIRWRCPVKIRLLHKKGLPFRLRPLWRRPGLLLGFFMAALLYYFLSCHVWMITVSGDGEYTKGQILAAAQEAGVFVGVGREDFDPPRAAQKIMRHLPALQWVSVNTNGCHAEIAVKHSDKKPEIVEKSGVNHLIAAQNGVIRSIVAEEGLPRVTVGTAVQKGDLLVAGLWDSNERKKEWLKTPEVTLFTAAARGIVMAETTRRFTVQLPKTKTVYQEGNSSSRLVLGAFWARVPIPLGFVGSGTYRKEVTQQDLYLLGKQMPLFFRWETLTQVFPETTRLTPAEAAPQLDLLLEKALRLPQGNRVLKRGEIVYGETAQHFTATLTCLCLENIALVQDVPQPCAKGAYFPKPEP